MNKVMILGGGIAGLYAAEKLVEKGIQVTLVEAKDHVGGNIQTHYEKDVLYETGAARFNKYHVHLIKLLQKYKLHAVPIQGEKTFHPVFCKQTAEKDRSYEHILQVLKYADKVSPEVLKQLTFGQVCEFVLGYEKTRSLVASFGYNAEFLLANAYTSIPIFREDFNGNTQYYICQEGLSELVKRMEENLVQKGVRILKMHALSHFAWKEDHFHVEVLHMITGKKVTLQTEHLVLALPKRELVKLDFFGPYQKTLLESVSGVNLHRIYAKYTRNWMREGVVRTTTDLPLRQFIPMDVQKGIAMVSYSDTFDADYWKIYADMGSEKLEEALKKQLKQLFPEKAISKTEWLRSYFWKEGVHVWNAGVDPTKVRKELQKIHPHLFLVGESYSLRQGWIEGALDTVHEILPKIQKGGNTEASYKKWMHMKKKVTDEDLERAKKMYPEFKWVLLQLPGETFKRVVDVTEWMNRHPGGVEPLATRIHKDITKDFLGIPFHKNNQTLKPGVLEMVKFYTLGQKV